jgi:hypothetical protein
VLRRYSLELTAPRGQGASEKFPKAHFCAEPLLPAVERSSALSWHPTRACTRKRGTCKQLQASVKRHAMARRCPAARRFFQKRWCGCVISSPSFSRPPSNTPRCSREVSAPATLRGDRRRRGRRAWALWPWTPRKHVGVKMDHTGAGIFQTRKGWSCSVRRNFYPRRR